MHSVKEDSNPLGGPPPSISASAWLMAVPFEVPPPVSQETDLIIPALYRGKSMPSKKPTLEHSSKVQPVKYGCSVVSKLFQLHLLEVFFFLR